jgi:hypothetical protein
VVMGRTELRFAGAASKSHEPHAQTLRVDQNVSFRRRIRPIDAHFQSAFFFGATFQFICSSHWEVVL